MLQFLITNTMRVKLIQYNSARKTIIGTARKEYMYK